MAVRRTVERMLKTSCMLNFSTAIWDTCLQKAFLSGECPLMVMKWSREIFSAPPNTSFLSISRSQGTWSSVNSPVSGENTQQMTANSCNAYAVKCPVHQGSIKRHQGRTFRAYFSNVAIIQVSSCHLSLVETIILELCMKSLEFNVPCPLD